MSIEVEVKARIKNPKELKSILQQRFGPPRQIHRKDQYFRQADDPRDPIRLRQEDQRCIVTYKERNEHDGIEQNLEIQFEIRNPEIFAQFLERLGFVPSFSKEKFVEVFHHPHDEPVYELVYIEKLGWFIEIELAIEDKAEQDKAKEKILHALYSLGLEKEDIEPRSYKSLLGCNIELTR